MASFEEFRQALERGHEKQALASFDELYSRKKEYYELFRQLIKVGATHAPGKRETHAFLPLQAALQSMQFLRTREEVALMTRRLIQYLAAVDKRKAPSAAAKPAEGDAREHANQLVHAASQALAQKPGPFAFACAAKELADYVGGEEAWRVLALVKKTGAPKAGLMAHDKLLTPKKEVDDLLCEASARQGAAENLVTGNALLKTRRLFSPKGEAHLFAVLERGLAKKKTALDEKAVGRQVGKTHGELHGALDDTDALLAHVLEPKAAHALHLLRELIAEKATLRALYPAFLIGGYYCGPAGRLDELVLANAACQVAERIEKPRALVPLAQTVLGIEARLKAGQRMQIPSDVVFPWE